MTANNLISNWQKAAMLTLRAFDLWLFAYALHPFICASRSIARFPRLAALKAAWIDILTTAEKRSEQRDLVFWRRMTMNGRVRFHGVGTVDVRPAIINCAQGSAKLLVRPATKAGCPIYGVVATTE